MADIMSRTVVAREAAPERRFARASLDAADAGALARTAAESFGAQWRARRRFTWLTTSGRALAVRIDEPAGEVVGAVVVAPSVGREAVVSYRTTRALAVHAARAGFVAYGFSFSGDGDSEDLAPEADTTSAWRADLAAVVAAARERVGDDAPVHVVGLRLGAAVAAHLERHDEGCTVLWEPVSGRSFVQQHRMLRNASVGGEPVADGVELDGHFLTDTQARTAAGLTAPTRSARAPRPGQLVRFERDRASARRIALGATFFATVPMGSIREIVADLPQGSPRPLRPAALAASARLETPNGSVVETFCEIGPGRLPGILTRSAQAPAVIAVTFTAMGAEVRWGPGTVWTRAARALAPLGALCLRVDRSGIGEDVDPDRTEEPRPYTDQSVTDVAEAVRHVGGHGLPVVGVGVCAGAWSLLRAAESIPLDALVAVNPVHWNPDASVYDEAFYVHYHGTEAPDLDNPSTPDLSGPTWRVRTRERLAHAEGVLRKELAIRLPGLRSLVRRDVPPDRVGLLLDAVPARVDLHLVLAVEEYRIFRGKGGPRAVRRARRRGGRVHTQVESGIEHSLLSERARRRVVAVLGQVVQERRARPA